MLFCYLFGTIWLAYQAGMSPEAALWAGVIPYVPFDIAKIYAALWHPLQSKKPSHPQRYG